MAESKTDEDNVSTSFEPDKFKLYTRRWLILFVLALLQTSNALVSWFGMNYIPFLSY